MRLSLATLATLAVVLPPAAAAQDEWLVRADTVYTAAGAPIGDGGFVLVADGKISGVGPGGGGGGEVLEVAAVTPGLIDLSVRIDTGSYSVEQATETPAQLSVADALDLFSHRWDRELRSGVTTVLATPQDAAVIGGLAVALKTGGERTLEARLLRADAVLRASMGRQPAAGNAPPRGTPPLTFYYRRPNTRMGVEWVFRNAFYEAMGPASDEEDADAPARREVLRRVLAGELPLSVQAMGTQDVRTAIYMKEEFGIPNMFLDAAVEAWREPELLQRSGVGIVLPPFPADGRMRDPSVRDSYFLPWNSAAELQELGVPVALSGHGARDVGSRLARQAGFAMRGGLSHEDALAAVTITPARMIGVDDRVGSIEVGKDADLVLWSGRPFEPTSRVVGVLVDGKLALDPREDT